MATLKVEIKRKCAICGNVFLAKFLDSRYCSPKCQKIASARKKAEEKRLQRLDELKQRIPDARDYISIAEAEALFGVSKKTLHRLVRNEAAKKVKERKEREARLAAEAKREAEARITRHDGVLDKFISEGRAALRAFALTKRTSFNQKEALSIYYGIMASASKQNHSLLNSNGIEASIKEFLSGLSWKDCSDFREECVCSWTKLFASKEVDFSESAISNFCAFVDHMSCCAETYVSLGGSNGCADQLTNWDGTLKTGLGAPEKKKGLSVS